MRYSAGIIPFRINNTTKELEFFLGHPGGYSWKNKNYWAFMKGHVEEGESWQDTAIENLRKKQDYLWLTLEKIHLYLLVQCNKIVGK